MTEGVSASSASTVDLDKRHHNHDERRVEVLLDPGDLRELGEVVRGDDRVDRRVEDVAHPDPPGVVRAEHRPAADLDPLRHAAGDGPAGAELRRDKGERHAVREAEHDERGEERARRRGQHQRLVAVGAAAHPEEADGDQAERRDALLPRGALAAAAAAVPVPPLLLDRLEAAAPDAVHGLHAPAAPARHRLDGAAPPARQRAPPSALDRIDLLAKAEEPADVAAGAAARVLVPQVDALVAAAEAAAVAARRAGGRGPRRISRRIPSGVAGALRAVNSSVR